MTNKTPLRVWCRIMTIIGAICLLLNATVSAQRFIDSGSGNGNNVSSSESTLLPPAVEKALLTLQSPSMLIADDAGNPQLLAVTDCTLSVRILESLVEVTAEYWFHNSSEREVEGVFSFPLPDRVTVDGYALGIAGEMVDGVAVPKKRAMVVFDTIERRGIDPGLLEWSGKNNFRSRVYPIFADNERAVQVRYADRIDGEIYSLPCHFDKAVPKITVKIEVIGHDIAPKIAADWSNQLSFEKTANGFVATAKLTNMQPANDILLDFSQVKNETLQKQTETTIGTFQGNDDGDHDNHDDLTKHPECYFVIKQPLEELKQRFDTQRLEREQSLRTPKRVAVYWDASGSRRLIDHTREIALLRQYLELKRPIVDLVVFRDQCEPTMVFATSDKTQFESLLKTLQNMPYDGASNPNTIRAVKTNAELGLLFTDAKSTTFSGQHELPVPQHPIDLMWGGAPEDRADHLHCLDDWVETAVDLTNVSDDQIGATVDEIGRLSLKLSKIALPADIAKSTTLVSSMQNSCWVAGKIVFPEGQPMPQSPITLQLHFACGNHEVGVVPITLDFAKSKTVERLPQRIWAQMTLAKLLADAKAHQRQILELGMQYHLVTPETSLLVLESIDQYLEFRIKPPLTQPELRGQYETRIAEWKRRERVQKERRRLSTKTQIANEWDIIRKWWQHTFIVPTNYQYVPQYTDAVEMFGSPRMRNQTRRYGYGGGYGGGGYGGGMGGGGRPTHSINMPLAHNIVFQPRVEQSPYLLKIRQAAGTPTKPSVENAYRVYLNEAVAYRNSPDFYFETAMLFRELGSTVLALRILGNIQELGLHDDIAMLRSLGYLMLQWQQPELAQTYFAKALQIDEWDFLTLRGLALAWEARTLRSSEHDKMAYDAFHRLLIESADHVPINESVNIESYLIASVEMSHLMNRVNRIKTPQPQQVRKPKAAPVFDVDLRIVAVASHGNADVVLSVREPHGEKIDRNDNLSIYGGMLVENFAREMPAMSEYMIHKAQRGKYKITIERFDVGVSHDRFGGYGGGYYAVEDFESWFDEARYADEDTDEEIGDEDVSENSNDVFVNENIQASQNRKPLAPGYVFVDIFVNYGRPNETRQSVCIPLDEKTEVYEIGEIAMP